MRRQIPRLYLETEATEALEEARKLKPGPEKTEALKKAGLLRNAIVRSPLTAASATFALKAAVWFRRGRLFMVSPVAAIIAVVRQKLHLSTYSNLRARLRLHPADG
jgi:hypothetical protein